jgi:hypothetical protein
LADLLLGRVVRLQVQLEPLKRGSNPGRRYDPAPLRRVPGLEVAPEGVTGLAEDGARLLDVHHTTHPRTRDRGGRAGVSLMATADYRRLRRRFGSHLADGLAGETLLIDTASSLVRRRFPGRLRIGTAEGGWLDLHSVRVAAPCAEFSSFCLDREPAGVDDEVSAAMGFLDHGGRGFRAVAAGAAILVEGAEVWVEQAATETIEVGG